MPPCRGGNKRKSDSPAIKTEETESTQATPIQAIPTTTPIQATTQIRTIKKEPEPEPTISCLADGCYWTSTSADKTRALLRHLRYFITAQGGTHKLRDSHEKAYATRKKERQSNPEKHKAAQVKYRMANRKKRSKASRLAQLKSEVRKNGETNEAIVKQKAKDLMEERSRSKL